MDELTAQTSRAASVAVGAITGDRVADELEMDPQLVGPAALKIGLDQGVVAVPFEHNELSARLAATLTGSHPRPIAPVAADRHLDGGLLLGEVALDQQQVLLVSRPVPELVLEGAHRSRCTANHEEPRRVLVEAVDDARTAVTGRIGQVREAGDEGVDQRT